MYAKEKPDRDHFDKLFCMLLGWMEVVENNNKEEKDSVWIWEADEDTGKLVLLGKNSDCQAFHKKLGDMIADNPEIEIWRG
jgi:hypothetical protein